MSIYKRIPENTFRTLQMNAGILCDSFDPETGAVGNILGATTGGIQIDATPEYTDMGEDIDNCAKNMMELKKTEKWECKVSGTYLTTSASAMKSLIGSATVTGGHVKLKQKLSKEDFQTIWFVGDYGENGYLAVKLSNALNTSGLSLKTDDANKGQMSFEYLGHYSIDAQDDVPLDIYIKDEVTVYSIGYTLSHVTATIRPIEVAEGGEVVAKFDPDADYSLPATVTVKAGNDTLTVDTDYTWDDETGILYINSGATTDDISITVTGESI